MTLAPKTVVLVEPEFPIYSVNKRHWITKTRIRVTDQGELVADIPEGFPTNFLSLPRVARLFWRTNMAKAAVAATVHDFGYREQQHLWSRGYVDRLFYRLLRQYGVGAVSARLFYWGVRANLVAELNWNKQGGSSRPTL